MSNIIKTILEEFVCEKFIDEKFHTLSVGTDMILLHSEYTSIKGCKKKCKIDIGRNIISLHTEKVYVKKHQRINTKEDNTICVNDEQITLKSSQTQDYQGIHMEKIISISIFNDEIICNSSAIKNELYENYTKEVN